MTHITRYGRRIKSTFIMMLTLSCIAIFILIPFVSEKMLNNNVGYYSITIRGNRVGAANTENEVYVALANARLSLCKTYDSAIYMDCDIEVTKESRGIAERMSSNELESAIYSALFDCVLDNLDTSLAYMLRIGDITMSFGSKDEIIELFTMIIKPYNVGNEFVPTLHCNDTAEEIYSISIDKVDNGVENSQIVSSFLEGKVQTSEDGKVVAPDILTEIGFEQEVTVTTVYKDKVTLTSVQDAYNEITKESMENTYYTVEPGDTLSGIANSNGLKTSELYALNEGMNDNTLIVPGDQIIITVPKSDITVITKKQLSYEEDYEAEPNYVDDNNSYRGTNTVISEGTTGHRSVVASVTYANGNETDRTLLQENVTIVSQPATISVGTLNPPTYIRPLYGGRFTSGFGYRSDGMHWGIDWSCPTGTTIIASCDGVVTRAGWYSDYGYCIDIRHSNGTMTRYAHNSKLLVSVGQRVSQGDSIALSGNTGNSTGPHCHFEVWVGNTRVNPLNYVNKY
ncbi:MAG: peptidoglycan DD-metalloendopeptidase family protein [Eubacteriales bacterium]|nr:peptidoglycan DD-metalloendopeptidase family protein [Eubacteriales bacterium]